ncbi:Proteasome subunit beta type-4 [Nymphon striatum]|nr:Proteasome subunit beta type-4 [Nymphon striatum]
MHEFTSDKLINSAIPGRHDDIHNALIRSSVKNASTLASYYAWNSLVSGRHPITTGTSVLGITFNGGVMIAADTLGSYGSLARFRNCPRVLRVNDTTILGAGGDYADYQFVSSIIEQKIIEEECANDGFNVKPKSLYSWLTRILYNRRSKFDPLWVSLVVGGLQNGVPLVMFLIMLFLISFYHINNPTICRFLGHVDKIGTAFEAPTIATGYGAYIAQPILRDAYETNSNMTREEAKELLIKCLRILFYRDARAFQKYLISTVTSEGSVVEGPFEIDTDWEFGTLLV